MIIFHHHRVYSPKTRLAQPPDLYMSYFYILHYYVRITAYEIYKAEMNFKKVLMILKLGLYIKNLPL